jgi:hypothetical protein
MNGWRRLLVHINLQRTRDIGIPLKEVRGIVFVLQGQKSLVICAKDRRRPCFRFVRLVIGVDSFV